MIIFRASVPTNLRMLVQVMEPRHQVVVGVRPRQLPADELGHAVVVGPSVHVEEEKEKGRGGIPHPLPPMLDKPNLSPRLQTTHRILIAMGKRMDPA